jgi:glycosyltransferase involved in cell wall biosynthesis
VDQPLVTIICLCHNHARFVLEALNSVAAQTYQQIQLIVVDDASVDGSKVLIQRFIEKHPRALFISHDVNVGNCKAFNSGFAHANGEFIIDLAADDILLPARVDSGVRKFATYDASFGVEFGDAYNIDEAGRPLGLHSDRYPQDSVPQGEIYCELIRRFFVCGTSMMFRKKVLDDMGGYDESLMYEDFDFWIRSSRSWLYFYNPRPLVKRRFVKGGHHEKQFRRGNPHAWSTLAVCRKILTLNRTKEEQSALQSRLRYELRQSVRRGDFALAAQYFSLWRQNRL